MVLIVVNIMSLVSCCLHLQCRLKNEREGAFKMLVSVSQTTCNHSMDDQSKYKIFNLYTINYTKQEHGFQSVYDVWLVL